MQVEWKTSKKPIDYPEAVAFMENRVNGIISGKDPEMIWFVEHPPVYTAGTSSKKEELLDKNKFPVYETGRGGKYTYHGPGQIVIYTLINLKRSKLSIRDLVECLELGIINYLASLGIKANGDRCAPGVYVEGKKIASLGLKVRKGCTYHGISFNAAMDTTPFNYINVCGYSGLKVVQLNELYKFDNLQTIANSLANAVATEVYK